jgi:hypothetical protein
VSVATLLLVGVFFAKDKKPGSSLLHPQRAYRCGDDRSSCRHGRRDPRANQIAESNVIAALQKWGRFQPVLSTEQADLIIVVRKGSDRLVRETITNPRQNDRVGMIAPSDAGVNMGAQHGQQSSLSTNGPGTEAGEPPHPQTEVGDTDDSFEVYEGDVDKPLDLPPGWRYTAKDGLQPHSVPAVDEFRKAIAKAEKAAANKKQS